MPGTLVPLHSGPKDIAHPAHTIVTPLLLQLIMMMKKSVQYTQNLTHRNLIATSAVDVKRAFRLDAVDAAVRQTASDRLAMVTDDTFTMETSMYAAIFADFRRSIDHSMTVSIGDHSPE